VSIARLNRLEARQPRARPWFDPWDAIMQLWSDLQAVVAGRAEWIRRPRKLGEEGQAAFDRMVAEHDSIARRLTANKPLQSRPARQARRGHPNSRRPGSPHGRLNGERRPVLCVEPLGQKKKKAQPKPRREGETYMRGRRYTVVFWQSNHSAAPSRGLFKCDGC
jgi:hypothetical protein